MNWMRKCVQIFDRNCTSIKVGTWTKVECVWDQVTEEDRSGQSGLLGLLWSSVVVWKLWGVFGLIMLLQDESFSTKMKPEGGACLWWMERCFSSVREESVLCRSLKTSSSTMFHCDCETLWCHSLSCSSPYIHPSVTDTNLSLGFIGK